MNGLLDKRVPIAWLLLTLIASGAIGILWFVISSGPPSNAVLIERRPDGSSAQAAAASGGQEGQNGEHSPVSAAATQSRTHTPSSPAPIAVYVSGAVSNPGVYTLPAEARVGDAINAAGGPQPEADMERINLAARLTDEQHIRVGRKGEPTVQADSLDTLEPGARPSAATTTQEPGSITEKINLNNADAAALEALPGIGEVLAARIVADREKNGPFKSVDDLKRVAGIKDAVLSRLRDLVYVEP